MEHKQTHRAIIAWTNVCRFLLAGVFLFSGFVKANDPYGTIYKVQDYFVAWKWYAWSMGPLPYAVALVIGVFEFMMGVQLLFGIRRRATSLLCLAAMLLLTPLTLWLAVTNPISDCGCFGDAIVLTNWQTFGKNAILLVAAISVCRWHKEVFRLVTEKVDWLIALYSFLFIVFFMLYCYRNLPVFDLRPFHIGMDIRKGMEVPEGEKPTTYETILTYSRKGVKKDFTLQDYPASDSTWTFVDSRVTVKEKGYEPPIQDFSVMSRDGTDLTDSILDNRGYTFLLIAPWLGRADDSEMDLINNVYDYCTEHGYRFLCLTASSDKDIAAWEEDTGAEYAFATTDEITLKTMMRANPGLMLLKGSTIIGKWSAANIPDENSLNAPLEKLPIGKPNPKTFTHKMTEVLCWFFIPFLCLVLADQMWIAIRALQAKRKKKKADLYINPLKFKNKMRKNIVAGNWKMNKTLQEGIALAKELNEVLTADKPNCDVIICTPFIHLASVTPIVDSALIGVGAENCADKASGAYTGEVSAAMVASTGAQYVILGHSERRAYYHETVETLTDKVKLALENNLKVIFCIGEVLAEREANKQNEVVEAQLASVFSLSAEDFGKVILAYEPVWAIGTGKTATPEQAEEIHAYIRSLVAAKYGQEVADNTSILYGGSCKPSNAKELFAKPDVDGGLIGGAALKAADFKGIIDAFK